MPEPPPPDVESVTTRAPFPVAAAPFLLHRLARRPLAHAGVLALVLLAVTASVSAQYAMKLLVDALSTAPAAMAARGGPPSAPVALALFLGLIATENALWRTSGFFGSAAILRVKADLRLDLFGWLGGHATRFFAEHLGGALANRVTAAGDLAHGMLGTLLWGILPPVADFCGAVIVLSTIEPRMALVLGVAVLFIAGSLAFAGLRGRPLHERFAGAAATVNGELVDVLGNIWTVKAFSARGRERARLAALVTEERTAQARAWRWLEQMRVFHDVCLCGSAGLILVWALTKWRAGGVTPGDVVIASALTFRILHGSKDLALALVGVAQQGAQLGDTLRVLGAPHDLPDGPDARTTPPVEGRVEYRNVGFAWPRRPRVFDRFDLVVPAGQRVGFVGPSGAGKSTLVGLLQRLEDVQAGRVLVDEVDVRAYAQDALRAGIAVVPQEIALFHRSVLENVRYARPTATDTEVRAAARVARCEEFIDALPDGWHTVVGERGIKLSGGQRQRLAIARAVLKDAPILVFDEATSALDTESEQAIQEALEALMGGRTVLAVAHRLSTLVRFDRIVVLAGGRIVEDGSPWELRRRGGVFDGMCRRQADGLLGDPPAMRRGG
jgi:ATP-binding cassette subfamily B protein